MEPTTRQLEILARCARGMTYQEIGRDLYLSPDRIYEEMAELRSKLGARNSSQALVVAIARGHICVDGRAGDVFVPESVAA